MKRLLLLLPLLILFSCSVQKRKYQKGFYVNWQHKDTREKHQDTPAKNTSVAGIKGTEPKSEISVSEKYKAFSYHETKLFAEAMEKTLLASRPSEDTCDVLVFKDGSEIKGKVLEIGVSEIKYKRCDTPDGPTYISKKHDLFMIKYANGTREVIKSEAPEPRVHTPVQKPVNYGDRRSVRQTHPLAAASMLAGILSIVFMYMIGILSFAGTVGLGVFALPLIAALIAVIAGKTAFKRMREQPEIWKGKGLARSGFIMGIIILAIYALILTIGVLLLI